jgi:hypothetical protein
MVLREGLSRPEPTTTKNRELDSSGGRHGRLVFPDSYDIPPGFTQRIVGVSVSSDVASELFRPPLSIGGRHGPVSRALVPKATVDEDGDTRPSKNKVRPTP